MQNVELHALHVDLDEIDVAIGKELVAADQRNRAVSRRFKRRSAKIPLHRAANDGAAGAIGKRAPDMTQIDAIVQPIQIDVDAQYLDGLGVGLDANHLLGAKERGKVDGVIADI